ncbi:MAG: ABC transporter permease [Defluviitaleaceae bacterium]|nr:ABC transporter permease [Defluviitaleaceae bacterium]
MNMLIKRHLLLFFRDKGNVFFSMLAVIIVIMLYIIFLADLMADAIVGEIPHASAADIRLVISGLVLSGTVAVATVSSCLSGMTRIIIDREEKAKDFFSSPIPRSTLMFSYVISSGIIGFIMSGLALITTVIYLSISGGNFPTLENLILLIFTLFLGVLSANSMMFLLTCFIKSRNAFGSLGSIIGTLIGFLTGVYIPIGQLPNGVAWIVRLFPTSHTASMFRQLLASPVLNDLGAPTELVTELNYFFGITFRFGSFTTNFLFSTLLLLGTSMGCYMTGLSLMRKRTLE